MWRHLGKPGPIGPSPVHVVAHTGAGGSVYYSGECDASSRPVLLAHAHGPRTLHGRLAATASDSVSDCARWGLVGHHHFRTRQWWRYRSDQVAGRASQAPTGLPSERTQTFWQWLGDDVLYDHPGSPGWRECARPVLPRSA